MKNKKRNFLGYLFILVLLIGGGRIYSIRNNNLLNKCSKKVNAIIIDKYKSKSPYVKYKYRVNNLFYESTKTFFLKDGYNEVRIGDSISIMVSCTHPDVSKIIKK